MIPVLVVQGQSLAETWEKAVLALWKDGNQARTEYDKKDSAGNFIDPPSIDATMVYTVLDPLAEPFIHRAFPGGLEDLEEYRMEVVEGIKDHWIDMDPMSPKWKYTYHDRLTRYPCIGSEAHINQLDDVVEHLARSPISRRIQAVTWIPSVDSKLGDPPCMQSAWFRIIPDEDGVWRLNMNIRFRSRDAYDAAFMNSFALVALMVKVADGVAAKAGRKVRLGRYCDFSDSFHLYGSRRAHFEENFLKQVNTRSFEERTWTREFAAPVFAEAREKVMEKIRVHDEEAAKAKAAVL